LVSNNTPDREFILRTLLIGCTFLGLISSITNCIFLSIEKESFDGTPPTVLFVVTLIFLALSFFARAGFSKQITYVLIFIFLILVIYGFSQWSVNSPQTLLISCISIVISGTLIGSKGSFFITSIYSILLITLAFLQSKNLVNYNSSWMDDIPTIGDGISSSAMLMIITVVCWLWGKEINKAFDRVKESEKALKKEKDNLEKEVRRRTKELKKTQLEKITNLYRFADFGRLTAGLFHDITNPLTQVSLNLDNIEHQARNKLFPNYKKINPILKSAIAGTKQMENLVLSVRNQIQQQETKNIYHPSDEIKASLDNLQYKATAHQVSFIFKPNRQITTFGNPIRFFQVVSNLVSNAIDAYYEVTRKTNRKIIINLKKDKKYITLMVQDFGSGIDPKNINKIYSPLFTTKGPEKGVGVGLYISRNIVEKELFGSIKVKSKINQGTTFFIKFPISKNNGLKKSS